MEMEKENSFNKNEDNSFSINNYFLNIRDSVYSMINNILSTEDQNLNYLNENRKIKSQNKEKKECRKISNKIKSQVSKNQTYYRNNRNNNKLSQYFIKKDNKYSFNEDQKNNLININTINSYNLSPNIISKNNIKPILNKDINKSRDFRNIISNCNSTNNENKKFIFIKSNNNFSNLKMSPKIHNYVQNILDNIPNVNKNERKNNKVKNEKSFDNNNYNNLNNIITNKFINNRNGKNYSQNILKETSSRKLKNSCNFNFYKNKTTYNNFSISYSNNKENNIQKINQNVLQNSYYFIEEKEKPKNDILSKSSSFYDYKKIKNDFQKIFFNISNIKFKHILISFLDLKSIACLSSINRIFYKNLRNIFFNDISKELFSDNKDIFIKKIIRSIFKYSSLKSKNKSELKILYQSIKFPNKVYTKIISNDLLRTFPNDPNFNEGNKYYIKLFNLLTCYSNYNKNIGYAQGLNFLFANAIYLFSSEEDIFLFIDGFINFLKLENYIGINNHKNLPELIKYVSDILEKYIPDIISIFNKKFMKAEFFFTNWILTIFSCSMNRKNLIICWCFMILFGWKFFYCFIIQILIHYQNIIYISNEIELCNKMKNILHSKEFNNDFYIIINKALDFMKDNISL